ncbi:MAG TPA: hypothetical protein VII76_14785 [Acidimicrobiales bacterium]
MSQVGTVNTRPIDQVSSCRRLVDGQGPFVGVAIAPLDENFVCREAVMPESIGDPSLLGVVEAPPTGHDIVGVCGVSLLVVEEPVPGVLGFDLEVSPVGIVGIQSVQRPENRRLP